MTNSDITSGRFPVQMVWEVLDLTVNGATPVTITPSKSVQLWTRIIWHMVFDDDAIDVAVFAGETSTLTNGIQFYNYGNALLDDPIVANTDFFKYGYDVNILTDGRSPKRNILSSRWTFSKSTPAGIVKLGDVADDFYIIVSDDLRPVTLTTLLELKVTLQGYQFITL